MVCGGRRGEKEEADTRENGEVPAGTSALRARRVRVPEDQRRSRGPLPAHSAAPRSCTPQATPLALSRRSAARQPPDPAPRSFSTQLTKMAEELGDEDLVDYEEDEVVDDKPADEVKK